MSVSEYIEGKKQLYQKVIEFLEEESNAENDLREFIEILDDLNIGKDKNELLLFLHLISSIFNNHHRTPELVSRTESIILHFKNQITKIFSNFQIFNIFKDNKRLLYFLFKENILIPDETIFKFIKNSEKLSKSYLSYFQPEFESFLTEINEEYVKKDTFEEYRKNGENENKVCQFIRDDKIDDFIVYVSQTNLSLSSKIKESIFETNQFLIGKEPTLIEYSAFYGSIQIFRYLSINNVDFTSSLWMYSIHGNNPEIIHLLEENRVNSNNECFNNCFIESIKCHHNAITNYIENVLIESIIDQNKILKNVIKSSNYDFFNNDLNCKTSFYYLCQYDHVCIVKLLLNSLSFNINETTISIQFFFKFNFNFLLFNIARVLNYVCLLMKLNSY